MDLILTEVQEELRLVVRRFLEEKSSEEDVRKVMATTSGYNSAVWLQMAEQLGLQGLIVPEEYGGSGCSYQELTVVQEEMGRYLLCAPYFSTVALGTTLLLASDDKKAMKSFLPGIASGSTIATVALTESSGRWDEQSVRMSASLVDGIWELEGEKSFVIDGCVADLILVVARTSRGVSVFATSRDAPGLTAEPMLTMDETRKQARLVFRRTPATLLGNEGSGWAMVSTMLDRATIALAAEQVGGAQRILELATEYAKNRIQFGRPIGSFQAIKHKCANMLLNVETARAAAYGAAAAAAEGDSEAPSLASMAKAFCSEAYAYVAAEAIQVHGGIGFTWDHPCHLYYKRARSSELMLGEPRYHRSRLAEQLGIDRSNEFAMVQVDG